jgi:excisionase family DNA binding protein
MNLKQEDLSNRHAVPYPALFTVPEACNELRVKKSKLYEMMRAGEVGYIKLGARSTRIPRAEILKWLNPEWEGR